MKIHLVTAEHFSVPGLIAKAFLHEADAMAEAAEFVNVMLQDTRKVTASGFDGTATPDQWGMHLELLQDYHGAAHCYVEITELDVAGGVPTDNDVLPLSPVDFDAMRYRLNEAVKSWPQFDVDETALPTPGTVDDEISADVNGGDLVEWFGEWRGRVKKLLAKVDG